MERNKKKKITQISRLRPGFKHWKIKAKIVKSLTPNEQQKTFRNKNNAGRKCIYLLGDDSGKIKLLSFGEYAERLESLQINEEYYISGAELGLSDKNYHQDNKYKLTVNEYTVIEPVGGGPPPYTSAQVGEEFTQKREVKLTPIPLKQVLEDSNLKKHFDVMGILKKSSKPEFKQHKTSTFYVTTISLVETTGETSIRVSANLQKDLKKLTDLKNQVIGFVGCLWKHYDKECIYAKLDNLYEEKNLPKVKVQNLKEWWCTQQKRSTRKRPPPSEKKSLHESAVGDPVQDPELLPSKKRKIESKMPLTRSKPIPTRCAAAYPFSKGKHNQRAVLSSDVKAEVSKSVGLIHIDGEPEGTGFRVGEKFIVTCVHVIKNVIKVMPHFIDCDRIAIEFERKMYNKREDPHQIFRFQTTVAYMDKEFDFVVLELSIHDDGVPFPPPLIHFGQVYASDNIHLVGHPGGRQMMEDSDVLPRWSPDHYNELFPFINELAEWSKTYFPLVNGEMIDYYSILLMPPRKILFHTSFDLGSSGSPGVTIRNGKPCVVLMLVGGAPEYSYDNPNSPLQVEDWRKVEFGFAMSDIVKKMWNSPQQNTKDLASKIFREFI